VHRESTRGRNHCKDRCTTAIDPKSDLDADTRMCMLMTTRSATLAVIISVPRSPRRGLESHRRIALRTNRSAPRPGNNSDSVCVIGGINHRDTNGQVC